MNCCCCGKPLRKNDVNGWHQACVNHFFGTSTIPQIEIDEKTLEAIAKEVTNESAQLCTFSRLISVTNGNARKMRQKCI